MWITRQRYIQNEHVTSEGELRLLKLLKVFVAWLATWLKLYGIEFWGGQISPQQTLFGLLTSRRGLGVTDPRDMIYAHIGMAGVKTDISGNQSKEPTTSHRPPTLNVDYRKSFEQLFMEVAIYMMDHIPVSKMLLNVEYSANRNCPNGLCSWVPDWTVQWRVEWSQRTVIQIPEGKIRRRSDGEAASDFFQSSVKSFAVPGVLAAFGMRSGIVTAIVPKSDLIGVGRLICWF
ncbi:hypothetical protein ACMFMG_009291 [Clarireedia jacksonii]